jgi:hypothetical protein
LSAFQLSLPLGSCPVTLGETLLGKSLDWRREAPCRVLLAFS